jgi:TRAP-type transport system periplasmic protein
MRSIHAIAGAIALAALALLPSRTTQAEAQFVANFGSAAPENTPWADQLTEIKTRVEKESGGRVKLKLFLGSVLGGEVEMVRDIRRNARLQGGGFSTGAVAAGANVPLLDLPELPYLFRNTTEADAVLDNVLWDPMQKELKGKGFVMVAWAENGWRNFATKTGPVKTPTELAKYKMRSQESKVHQAMYTALGVQAVTLPVSEVITSLQTGVVDGFDNTPLFTQAAGWYQPIKYYNLSRHIYQPAAVVYGSKFWDALPADLQTILMGDPKATSASGRKGVRGLETQLLANFKDMGVTVVDLTDAEREVFAAKVRNVHLDFVKTTPGADALMRSVNAELKKQRGG